MRRKKKRVQGEMEEDQRGLLQYASKQYYSTYLSTLPHIKSSRSPSRGKYNKQFPSNLRRL